MRIDMDFDWIVIGSGFGGSVSALRLAEKGYRVAIIEQGNRFSDNDFAQSSWNFRKILWAPQFGMRGILRLAPFKHTTVLSGVGVGGGSLVYANTLYEPHADAFYQHRQWGQLGDWRAELAPHFATAKKMLGVTQFCGAGSSEKLMDEIAAELGAPQGAQPTPVSVYFGIPGKTVPDPYFDGNGPERTGCIRCGQCMLGCRHGSKNSLTKNYLWFAEKLGVQIIPQQKVELIETTHAGGYLLSTKKPGTLLGPKKTYTTKGIVLSAGTLGTNEILRKCYQQGTLPKISSQLGKNVRTNAEAIPAATAFNKAAEYCTDIAITRSIFLDNGAHITNNTFGLKGGAIAAIFGPIVNSEKAFSGWLELLARYPQHLWRTVRTKNWSKQSVLFTIMGSEDISITLTKGLGPGGLQTSSTSTISMEPVRSLANKVAVIAARKMKGYAQASTIESAIGSSTTAHFLGGAIIGSDKSHGVIDTRHQLFGYSNFLVCDGSSVPANIGVNPSLTITAMAERAMSFIPEK
ncbi:MAG: FAD-dependent oxidoreductase [Mycobacteriaceae bacterium]